MADETPTRFFIVGDIGHPGVHRARVAKAMGAMIPALNPLFVLTTGDNIYGEPTDNTFEDLKTEMLDEVPLPWYVTLGNHDVGSKEFAWHMRDYNSPEHKWEWYCPSPCYHLNTAYRTTKGPELPTYLDILVVNTNKYNTHAKAGGVSMGLRWWGDQKKFVRNHMNTSRATWKIVVGHHPIEYIPQGVLEHRIPGIRYIPTTFMKGGLKSRAKGTSMRDAIVDTSNLYICGHQHLTAHFVKEEGKCEFSLIGNSSKVEDTVTLSGDERASDTSSSSSDGDGFKSKLKSKFLSKFAAKTDEDKYASFWHSNDTVGFAVAEASYSYLHLTYYSVDHNGNVRETNRQSITRPK
eukprot:TRINITY_DN2554_c0_g5_i1.p1 TRINITY_DN2554_c0_g5~~TRINITY_DN2554_c0_g5_i1.p1  ORF type:complete len:357 (+),score=58.29 TRINITY_DN2554_c0_g5_i1:23-1072(+)